MADVTAHDPRPQELGQIRRAGGSPAPEARADRRHDPLPGDHLDDVTARDLMTPGVIAVTEDASLRQGFRSMAAHGKHAILVLGRTNGQPLGWITDRGLLAQLGAEHPLRPVRDAITEEPVMVTPGTTAREMASKLARAGTTHLLVIPAGGHLPEGVVSALDLVAAAAG